MRFPLVNVGSKLLNSNFRIKDASSSPKWHEVLCHYREMNKARAPFTDFSVFHSVFKAFSNLSLKHGEYFYGYFIKQGLDSFTSISNSAIDFYMKWGDLDSAQNVFDCLENRDSISWNIMVHGNINYGSLEEGLLWFKKGRNANFAPNTSTLVLVIRACRKLEAYHEGLQFHGYVIRCGFWVIPSVQNSLLALYADINIDCAHNLFDEMPERDVISWSIMIGGYTLNNEPQAGLHLFKTMLSQANPDGVTMVSVIKTCANLEDIKLGIMIHGLVIVRGLEFDLFIGNSLIDMYSRCNAPQSAFEVFNEMAEKNIVSLNSMLSSCVLHEKHWEALSLLYSTEMAGIEADEVTLVNILQLCKHFVHPLQCKSVHCVVIRKEFETNELVVNSLMDVYAKCYLVKLAYRLFERISRKDVVSWSTMIAGFTYCGQPDQAMAIFKEMNQAEVKPNEITMINLLESCALFADSKRSKLAHGVTIKRWSESDVAIGTCIIDMYSKSGEIESSRKVFDQISGRNVVSWSAMIRAYGINGLGYEAIALLSEMKRNGVEPNSVTALSFLSACNHSGLVEDGISFFKSMITEHKIVPSREHYSCVVDMLCRAGKLENAVELISRLPEGMDGSASLWGAVLCSCRNQWKSDSDLAFEGMDRLLQLEPMNSFGYMIGSSLYAANGLMGEAAKMRKMAKERGVKVCAGFSLVHVEDMACKFIAGDGSHPEAGKIYSMVKLLHDVMKINQNNITV